MALHLLGTIESPLDESVIKLQRLYIGNNNHSSYFELYHLKEIQQENNNTDMRDHGGISQTSSQPGGNKRRLNNNNGGTKNHKNLKDKHAQTLMCISSYEDDFTDVPKVPDIHLVKKSQLETNPKQFLKVMKLKAWIERKKTTVGELSPGVLKYKTPHFRAEASVEVPALCEGERIQVGWIQVCVNMQFINTYGDEGITSWEFPEMISGKHEMISDADGKQYPWYGEKRELATVTGPSKKQTFLVEMNDNFFPQVTWHIPGDSSSSDLTAKLSHIHRYQTFYTCLAVRDMNTGKMYIYRTLVWTMELNIAVDPSRPLGGRATVLEPFQQQQPKLLKHNVTLPLYSLKAPNANRSQVLVWRPFSGKPSLVVPPLETTMDMDQYLISTRDLVDKLTTDSHSPGSHRSAPES